MLLVMTYPLTKAEERELRKYIEDVIESFYGLEFRDDALAAVYVSEVRDALHALEPKEPFERLLEKEEIGIAYLPLVDPKALFLKAFHLACRETQELAKTARLRSHDTLPFVLAVQRRLTIIALLGKIGGAFLRPTTRAIGPSGVCLG